MSQLKIFGVNQEILKSQLALFPPNLHSHLLKGSLSFKLATLKNKIPTITINQCLQHDRAGLLMRSLLRSSR